jgi:hypothetical protein
MTKTFRHTYLRRALLASTVAIGVGLAAAPASAQIVFDPSNYAQNVLTAARALQQINNQITSLANQTQMLVNQAESDEPADLHALADRGNFSKMTSLMGRPRGSPITSRTSISNSNRLTKLRSQQDQRATRRWGAPALAGRLIPTNMR